jgi:hypothetical protein
MSTLQDFMTPREHGRFERLYAIAAALVEEDNYPQCDTAEEQALRATFKQCVEAIHQERERILALAKARAGR